MKENRTRKNQFVIRLNDTEMKKLNYNLRITGATRESYIRCLINGIVPKQRPDRDCYVLIHELHKIGGNLNQIALKANSTGVIDAEKYSEEVENFKVLLLQIEREMFAPEKI